MWMLGYNDGGDINMADAHSLGSRKLRPIMPRPSSATTPPNLPCLSRVHGTDFIALNHHHLAMAERTKREFNTQTQVVVSSRWNPTPEQLQTLEELYRRGTRTPSADQIQQITAQLRRFGKIEGKNVFYWFQNHKARERQKRRRQQDTPSDDEHQPNCNTENIDKKDPGSSMVGFEIEQNKNWATHTYSCTRTLPEKTVSIQMAASKAAERTGVDGRAAEDGWLHFDHHADHNLQQQRSTRTLVIMERNDTWQHLINSTITTTAPSSSTTITIIDPKPHQDYAIFFDSPARTRKDDIQKNGEVCFQECPTLQLFPLRSDNDGQGNDLQGKETQPIASDEPMENPYQFFEFLPLKN